MEATNHHPENMQVNQGYYDFYSKQLPVKYRDTNFYPNEIKDFIGKSIFLYGKSGSGKTTIAAELARNYIWQLKKIQWINYPDFIMGLQKSFWNTENKIECKNPYQKAEDISKAEILIIDDLGAEKISEFVRQITYFIINHREQNNLITIITSNLSLDDISKKIDERISSRICGLCEIIELKNKDYRLK